MSTLQVRLNDFHIQALKTLSQKNSEDFDDVEKMLSPRLKELKELIERGENVIESLKQQLNGTKENVTKAIGAYENVADILLTHYHSKAKKGKQEEKTADVVKFEVKASGPADVTGNQAKAE